MDRETLRKNIKNYRRDLHQIPETGYKEFKTQEYLMTKLRDMGYSPEKICDTGVFVHIKGESSETIAFRSDIDALPIKEETACSFASTHEGNMHACGHDGHMAILLGFAQSLRYCAHLKKSILLIFQPAEEGPGGGAHIVQAGLLKRYSVEGIFGIHLFPGLKEGVTASKPGPLMAQPTEINIDVIGKSGHGAMPQTSVDSIIVTAKLLEAYQSIISRSLSPLSQAVITFGKIRGGTVRNIIAETTRIEGTIRTFSKEVLGDILQRIEEVNRGFEISHRVKIDCQVDIQYPPVLNDRELFRKISDLIDDRNIEPLMLAEDFSYYQEAVPGVFIFLGTRNDEKNYTAPLHNSKFNFDERVLIKGVDLYMEIMQRLNFT